METISDAAIADNIRLRAVKRARRDNAGKIGVKHVRPFLDLAGADGPKWSAAALARVSRVPEMVRETVKSDVEDMARERDISEITLELAEEGIAEIRKAMCPVPEAGSDVDSAG